MSKKKVIESEINSEPREYSTDEVKDKFLRKVWGMIRYWETVDTEQNRMEGLAFSMLAMLDGCQIDLPGFIVAPCPADEDKQYHIDHGENYYAPAPKDVVCDIAGGLHDRFHKLMPKK